MALIHNQEAIPINTGRVQVIASGERKRGRGGQKGCVEKSYLIFESLALSLTDMSISYVVRMISM